MKIYLYVSCIVCLCVFHGSLVAQDSITNRFGMQFILVKPGNMTVAKFQPTVGEPGQDVPRKMYDKAVMMARRAERPGFNVQIKHAFYLGKFEVTQQQWMAVMGNNPCTFINDSSANYPVESVTWSDAQAFVTRLNQLDSEHTYRLPTEFEWEYAARAGATDDIPWKNIQQQAVLSGKSPAKVGSKQPNDWGFYDMLGNVWEHVNDWYNEKIFADPKPPKAGTQHVLKGASFTGDVKNATYMTHAGGPGNGFDVGLRVVMEPNGKLEAKP